MLFCTLNYVCACCVPCAKVYVSAHAPAQCLSFISNASILMLSLCDSLHLFYILSLMFSQSPHATQCVRLPCWGCLNLTQAYFFFILHSHSLFPRSFKCLCCLSFIAFLHIKELQTLNLNTLTTHSPHKNTRKTYSHSIGSSAAHLHMHAPHKQTPKTLQNTRFHVLIFSTSN